MTTIGVEWRRRSKSSDADNTRDTLTAGLARARRHRARRGARIVAAGCARSTDEQRCTGAAGTTPEAQAAACTVLIDSRKFTRQNLAILHSNRGIAYGKAGDYSRAIADFDAALKIPAQSRPRLRQPCERLLRQA